MCIRTRERRDADQAGVACLNLDGGGLALAAGETKGEGGRLAVRRTVYFETIHCGVFPFCGNNIASSGTGSLDFEGLHWIWRTLWDCCHGTFHKKIEKSGRMK